MIKVIVAGAGGKMGQLIINLALNDKSIELVGALEAKGHPMIDKDIVIDNFKLKVTDDLTGIINKADVVIDFTNPAATLGHLEIIARAKKRAIIGATGLNDKEVASLRQITKDIACVFSPNMSIGVNLLFKLAEETARVLGNYDVEIVEAHHNLKKDAPSGTAAMIARIIAKTMGRDLEKDGVYGRQGIIGARKKNEIGIHSVRAGDIVGDHTVIFAGTGERLELVHRAHSRETFAQGALTAAKWIIDQPKGLYDMQDVLGLR
jgi:4-hydroxy-tetrahydrodipicolinate reductase